MQPVTIYTTSTCPYCMRAKMLLKKKGVAFDEISVDGNPALRREMAAKAGATSVPQIWVGEEHIGGCDDMFMLERKGALDLLLEGNPA